jgi:hypothetical protein
MSIERDVVFFLAPDDETAAATRDRGPGPAFTSVTCHDFEADEAIVQWEMYFEAPARELPPVEQRYRTKWPRDVAPVLNDGIGVFAFSDYLTHALATAAPEALDKLAARWAEQHKLDEGCALTDNPLQLLKNVAQLAANAAVPEGPRLYCWHH